MQLQLQLYRNLPFSTFKYIGYLQKGLKPFYEILRKIRKTNNFLWDDSKVKLF